MKIFTGTSNPLLAQSMADYLGIPLGKAQVSRFPDGETWVKILENVRGKDVFVVQSTCYPPNENLMELLIMIDAMRRASAARITAVLPFYGYARQDRKDQPRVPITAKLVANLLVAAGTNRLLTVDFHAQQLQGFFDIPVDHLYSSPVLMKYLQEKNLPNLVVVSPDTGGLKMAHAYSEMLHAGLALVAKQRKGPTEVEALTMVGDVRGCNCVLVDDLATTAGTLTTAARILKANGAESIYAVVTHAVLTELGYERLKNSDIKELVVTDTVPLREAAKSSGVSITVLSVAGLLGEAVLRIHDNQSVSSLFKV
ncbi:MAG: ribose-phosphate pyrophosphokinase [bacterium]|jgi:ribose-phosphate pyrophosphokinase